MLLSDNDINRIKKLGYTYDFFVEKNKGWLQLKNKEGLCVFHNGIKCSIYKNRPEGCQLYPIIYDKDNNCVILDDECSHRTKFIITSSLRKKLYNLVSRVETEKTKR
jgi:Fe-S-cluster containining protein